MKKAMFILPGVLACLVYGFLAILVGGFAGFQLTAWMVIGCTVASGVLLSKGFWWGCIPGVALASFLQQTSLMLAVCIALYYVAAGIWCAVSAKSQK